MNKNTNYLHGFLDQGYLEHNFLDQSVLVILHLALISITTTIKLFYPFPPIQPINPPTSH